MGSGWKLKPAWFLESQPSRVGQRARSCCRCGWPGIRRFGDWREGELVTEDSVAAACSQLRGDRGSVEVRPVSRRDQASSQRGKRRLAVLADSTRKPPFRAAMPVSASNLTPSPGWQAAPGNRHADAVLRRLSPLPCAFSTSKPCEADACRFVIHDLEQQVRPPFDDLFKDEGVRALYCRARSVVRCPQHPHYRTLTRASPLASTEIGAEEPARRTRTMPVAKRSTGRQRRSSRRRRRCGSNPAG
jgi:hypothetical protein